MKVKRIARVLAIALVQYLVAFLSWSLLPGNAAPGAGREFARVIWGFAQFPLFYLFPRDLLHFDLLLIANAVIWGVCFGWIAPAMFQNRR